jgi:hypothetical protein
LAKLASPAIPVEGVRQGQTPSSTNLTSLGT